MGRLKYLIQDNLSFNPKETKGFILCIFLMIGGISASPLYKQFVTFNNDSSIADKKKLDSLVAFIEKNQIIKENNPSHSHTRTISFSNFDPNTIDQEGFLSLGIDEKVAKRIINYRNKGGQFRIKSDFKKMYGLSEQLYLSLYPYIDLPETKETAFKANSSFSKEKVADYSKTKYTKPIFDINKADTTQLQSLYGIGSKLAKRIISFRDKLGGFVSKDQYAEVYGLDTAVVKVLKERSLIEASFTPAKININTATLEKLKEHPYIRFKIAKLLLAYRQQHGNFSSIEDIKKIKPINDAEFIKLKSYIEL